MKIEARDIYAVVNPQGRILDVSLYKYRVQYFVVQLTKHVHYVPKIVTLTTIPRK